MERDLTGEAVAARVRESETRTAKVVAPGITNVFDTLSGGTLLMWMDEIAAITAGRFGRVRFTTASLERTDFRHPIPSGSIVELVARVTRLGRTSLQVKVDVHVEHLFAQDRQLAVTGLFTMVAVGDDKRPIPIVV
jgi:acyl-CoA hydrolase